MSGQSCRNRNNSTHGLIPEEAVSLAASASCHPPNSHHVPGTLQTLSLVHILLSKMRKQTLRDIPKDTQKLWTEAKSTPSSAGCKVLTLSTPPITPLHSFTPFHSSGKEGGFPVWNKLRLMASATLSLLVASIGHTHGCQEMEQSGKFGRMLVRGEKFHTGNKLS